MPAWLRNPALPHQKLPCGWPPQPIPRRPTSSTGPQLIRVDESVLDVDFALFAANPEFKVARLVDLRGSSLVVGYRRGVVYCEQELGSVWPAAQIAHVTQEEQGLRVLVAGRIDMFCGMDTAVWSAMELPTLRNGGIVGQMAAVAARSGLFPPFALIGLKRGSMQKRQSWAVREVMRPCDCLLAVNSCGNSSCCACRLALIYFWGATRRSRVGTDPPELGLACPGAVSAAGAPN